MLSTFKYAHFLSVKQHKSLEKMSTERTQVPEQKNFQATSATSGPTPDYMRTCSKNSEFSVYKYSPNLPSNSFLYNSHFP